MIHDHIDRLLDYTSVVSSLSRISEELRRIDAENAAPARVDLIPGKLYYMIQRYTTRPESEVRFEAHRRFIDLQFLSAGRERIYCADVRSLRELEAYDQERDIAFFDGDPTASVDIGRGMFALLFPGDAHRPTCSIDAAQAVTKIVFKIAVD